MLPGQKHTVDVEKFADERRVFGSRVREGGALLPFKL
jgi:hypothetical protein